MLNYKELCKNIIQIFNNINTANNSLVYIKKNALSSCLNLRKLIYYAELDINQETSSNLLTQITNSINEIIKCDDKDHIAEIMKNTIIEDVLLKINNILFLAIESDFYGREITTCEKEECDFESLVKDLRSSKKFLNLFYVTTSTYRPTFNFLKEWDKIHPNCEMRHYCYFANINNGDNLHQWEENFNLENNDMATKNLYGIDHNNFKISTQFDIGYLDLPEGTSMKNLENTDTLFVQKNNFFYVNSHVKIGSPIIIRIDDRILTYDYIQFLSYYLEDISVYHKENQNGYLIIGTATKKRNEDVDNTYDLLDKIINPQESEFYYDIFGDEDENILFRSLYMNEEDANKVFKIYQKEIKKNFEHVNNIIEEKNKEDARQPLIPFNPGQLGLVLVSGDIDGIVDEGNGNYHLIKGSTKRRPNSVQTIEGDVDVIKVTNNVVTSITAMLTNGQILELM